MRETKIVCTLGPATDDDEILRQLIINGMDVARQNFSHGVHADHKRRFEQVKKIREELGKPVAMLLDTKGPEVRIGLLENNEKVLLKKGQKFVLTTRDIVGNVNEVSITHKKLGEDVQIGTKILIDDGLVGLKVTEIINAPKFTDIVCVVLNDGYISNRKGVNVPGINLSLPYISEADRKDIIFGIEEGYDFIAASFVRCADDVLAVRQILDEFDNHTIRVIAKIENQDGVKNIDEILRVSDGIMIARGDMGVEIDFEDIPSIQKALIKKGYNAGLQVITATQMLDSMMKNPRPTRAETTDVANAIYDGTSAIMLSGETAAGAYPVEAVHTMAQIAERTENDIDYRKRFYLRDHDHTNNVTNAISHATVTTAHDLGAAAIITVTKTGSTARMISKFRPVCPIISCTPNEMVQRQMNMSWGVIPLLADMMDNTDALIDHAIERAREEKLVSDGDLVVVTAGVPLGVSGTTNLMKVHLIGDVLVSGKGYTSKCVTGTLCVCNSEEEALKNFKNGDILVIPQTSNNIMSILKNASAIVTELEGGNSHAAIVGMTLDIPVVVGAAHATEILKSGTVATVDAYHGTVGTAAN